jgi:transposase
VLVGARTALVNAIRGLTKAYGERLRKCHPEQIRKELAAELSPELRTALEPLFQEVQSLTERIQHYDHEIEKIAKQHYPEVAQLQQVNGVGTLIALTYVLTVDDPPRFGRSRDLGWHGLNSVALPALADFALDTDRLSHGRICGRKPSS